MTHDDHMYQRSFTIWLINKLIKFIEKLGFETDAISDTYHTFGTLYHHRTILFAALLAAYPDKSWRTLKYELGSAVEDGYFLAGIHTPDGDYSYHVEDKYWEAFHNVPVLLKAPVYDGHKERDVDRLLSLCESDIFKQMSLYKEMGFNDEIHKCEEAVDGLTIADRSGEEGRAAVLPMTYYNAEDRIVTLYYGVEEGLAYAAFNAVEEHLNSQGYITVEQLIDSVDRPGCSSIRRHFAFMTDHGRKTFGWRLKDDRIRFVDGSNGYSIKLCDEACDLSDLIEG